MGVRQSFLAIVGFADTKVLTSPCLCYQRQWRATPAQLMSVWQLCTHSSITVHNLSICCLRVVTTMLQFSTRLTVHALSESPLPADR